MLFRTLLAVALVGSTHAQVEDIPDTERLDVVFGPRPIHAPGALMHPGYMSNTPNISTPAWDPESPTALLLMVDLDWPLDSSRVSRLHWLATGLTLSSTAPPPDGSTSALLTIPSSEVQYMQPAPPIGDIAHTYAFTLFRTPPSFSLPPQYEGLGATDSFDENGTLVGADTRAPFDIDVFLRDCNLSADELLARNSVRVRNLAGHPTTTFPPPREATGVLGGEGPEESEGEGGGEERQVVASGGGAGSVRVSVGAWIALFVVSGALCVVG